jgi:hypothetical protein
MNNPDKRISSTCSDPQFNAIDESGCKKGLSYSRRDSNPQSLASKQGRWPIQRIEGERLNHWATRAITRVGSCTYTMRRLKQHWIQRNADQYKALVHIESGSINKVTVIK